MSEHEPIRGMDHVGITVPDLDAALRFLMAAFDGKYRSGPQRCLENSPPVPHPYPSGQ
jgi:hypothetical protein